MPEKRKTPKPDYSRIDPESRLCQKFDSPHGALPAQILKSGGCALPTICAEEHIM
jgi:hypothetical protein